MFITFIVRLFFGTFLFSYTVILLMQNIISQWNKININTVKRRSHVNLKLLKYALCKANKQLMKNLNFHDDIGNI